MKKKLFSKKTSTHLITATIIFLITRVFIVGLTIFTFKFHIEEGFSKNFLNYTFGTFDGDLYRKIAEFGYILKDTPDNILTFSFLPIWPLILKIGHLIFPFLSVVEIGLILNQILTFSFLLVLFKLLDIHKFSLKEKIICTGLILLYPGSIFFNFNYNEALYLNILGLVFIFWHQKKYLYAIILGYFSSLLRFNIIVVIGGLASFEIIKYLYFAWKEKIQIKEIIKNNLNKIPYLILLLGLFLPLIFWMNYLNLNFGEDIYFKSQKTFFREVDYRWGPINTIESSLLFFPLENIPEKLKYSNYQKFSSLLLITISFLCFYLFKKIKKEHILISLIFPLIFLIIISLNKAYFNIMILHLYLNILVIYLLIEGLWSLLKQKDFRIYFIPTLFSIYLPFASSTFYSMNRYILHSFPLFIGIYAMTKEKKTYLRLLYTIFIFGYAIMFIRFLQSSWAG